tara:strand:+ start:3198 stop:3371 length:174 start_codon:yes stop_codon:yes gene_type:complete
MSWLEKVRSFFSRDEEGSTQDLDNMKLAELRAVAKDRGMKGISGLRKAQLLERLKNN